MCDLHNTALLSGMLVGIVSPPESLLCSFFRLLQIASFSGKMNALNEVCGWALVVVMLKEVQGFP